MVHPPVSLPEQWFSGGILLEPDDVTEGQRKMVLEYEKWEEEKEDMEAYRGTNFEEIELDKIEDYGSDIY